MVSLYKSLNSNKNFSSFFPNRSFGCILYELIEKRSMYSGRTFYETMQAIVDGKIPKLRSIINNIEMFELILE